MALSVRAALNRRHPEASKILVFSQIKVPLWVVITFNDILIRDLKVVGRSKTNW